MGSLTSSDTKNVLKAFESCDLFFLGADVKSQQRHFMTFLRPLLGYKNDIPNKEGVYVMKFWLDIC